MAANEQGLLHVIEFEKQKLKYMYTVEQIREAGAKAQYRYAVEPIIEALQELYGSEPQQLLQQTQCKTLLPSDPFEFIDDAMEKELRLRQMIDEWCEGQFGNTDEAIDKAEKMFVAARDTFYGFRQ